MSQLIVLAGPNGAGKSTFYDAFLAESPLLFLNADLLAAETGIDSLEAARILDAARDRMIESRISFIAETVFSDPKLDMMKKAVEARFDVTLIYIGVVDAALSAKRVDQRIAIGGHDVPRDRIASRFERSLRNLAEAIKVVPTVKLYDNSSIAKPYRPIAVFKGGQLTWRARGAVPAWARAIVRPIRRKR